MMKHKEIRHMNNQEDLELKRFTIAIDNLKALTNCPKNIQYQHNRLVKSLTSLSQNQSIWEKLLPSEKNQYIELANNASELIEARFALDNASTFQPSLSLNSDPIDNTLQETFTNKLKQFNQSANKLIGSVSKVPLILIAAACAFIVAISMFDIGFGLHVHNTLVASITPPFAVIGLAACGYLFFNNRRRGAIAHAAYDLSKKLENPDYDRMSIVSRFERNFCEL